MSASELSRRFCVGGKFVLRSDLVRHVWSPRAELHTLKRAHSQNGFTEHCLAATWRMNLGALLLLCPMSWRH